MPTTSLDEDLTFLRKLDAITRSTKMSAGRGNFPAMQVDDYKDMTLTEAALEEVLAIVERNNLIFQPTTTTFGFSTAYEVLQATQAFPGADPDITVLLRFRDESGGGANGQLPPGYNFDRLSQTFLNERNTQLREFFGFSPIRDKTAYEY